MQEKAGGDTGSKTPTVQPACAGVRHTGTSVAHGRSSCVGLGGKISTPALLFVVLKGCSPGVGTIEGVNTCKARGKAIRIVSKTPEYGIRSSLQQATQCPVA